MSWKRQMLYFATAEQRATIKRLSTEVIWQTAFNDWLETRFGRDHSIDPRDGAKVVIDALKSKLRNQKRGWRFQTGSSRRRLTNLP